MDIADDHRTEKRKGPDGNDAEKTLRRKKKSD